MNGQPDSNDLFLGGVFLLLFAGLGSFLLTLTRKHSQTRREQITMFLCALGVRFAASVVVYELGLVNVLTLDALTPVLTLLVVTCVIPFTGLTWRHPPLPSGFRQAAVGPVPNVKSPRGPVDAPPWNSGCVWFICSELISAPQRISCRWRVLVKFERMEYWLSLR